MNWIWPEYINRDLPLTRRERKAIHRSAWRLWWTGKWNVGLYLTLPAFYLLTVFFASDVGSWLARLVGGGALIDKTLRAAAPFALFILCFVLGGALLQRYRFAPCVYRATRQHGHDVCIKCGYWLRGLPDDRRHCPECGAAREAPPPGGSS
jgi:hypothetical protein